MSAPVFASTLGQIFQPLFQAMAWLIATFYAVIPNYAVAIAILTVVVMIVTAPLTVKSTRSMVAMQRLAPEMKKLQAKYKGDKQKLNEEMMALYREHGVNPAGGCLPMLIQFPIFIILYDVIRGLINTVKKGHYYYKPNGVATLCRQTACASPRYIGHGTKLYASLLHNAGTMPAFGIDLAAKVLGQHSFTHALPYAALILVAIALQYLQMRQLNSRNPQMAQANPQAQMMQRYMPILFAVIYINIAAGVNIYFIVSSLCRIGIQEGVFRSGILSRPAGKVSEEALPGRGGATPQGRRTFMERLADAQKRALEQQEQQRVQRAAIEAEASSAKSAKSADGKPVGGPTRGAPPAGKRPASSAPAPRSSTPTGPVPKPSRNGANGAPSPNGSRDKGTAQSRSKARRGKRPR